MQCGEKAWKEAGALGPPHLVRGPENLLLAAVTQPASSRGQKPTRSDAASSEDQGQSCTGSGILIGRSGCCLLAYFYNSYY